LWSYNRLMSLIVQTFRVEKMLWSGDRGPWTVKQTFTLKNAVVCGPWSVDCFKTINMKKISEKKLSLGKIKIASLSKSKQELVKGGMALTAGTCSVLCSLRICTDNISQGAEICSEDSCRF
jgi:hypothetical protein